MSWGNTCTASQMVQLPTGIYVSEATAYDLAMAEAEAMPTAIDVFAGAGGMSLGLIQSGFKVVAGIDHHPTAAITYMHNLGAYPCRFHFTDQAAQDRLEKEMQAQFTRSQKRTGIGTLSVSGCGWISNYPDKPGVEHFFLGDVRKLTGKEILQAVGMKPGELGLLAGGPPCQGFSRAGKRNIMDPRNSLVFDFARLICEIRPKAIVMENVPGIVDMLTPDGVLVMDAFTRILEDGGFNTHDALTRAMRSNPSCLGLLRGKKTTQGEKRPPKPSAPEGQLPLWGKAA